MKLSYAHPSSCALKKNKSLHWFHEMGLASPNASIRRTSASSTERVMEFAGMGIYGIADLMSTPPPWSSQTYPMARKLNCWGRQSTHPLLRCLQYIGK